MGKFDVQTISSNNMHVNMEHSHHHQNEGESLYIVSE